MNRIRNIVFTTFTTMAAFSITTKALADFDIAPAVDGGKIKTNAFEDATNTYVGNVRVFHYAFGDGPFFAQDPGFHPQPGSGFGPGQQLSLSVATPLQYWNGIGSPSFGVLPSNESLKLQNGTPFLIIGSTAPGGTLNIATTDSFGEFDHHLSSTLTGSGINDPADGLYLTSFLLHNPGGTALDSLPFYVIYNNNLSEDIEAIATISVRDNFAPLTNVVGVPEPTVTALLGIGGLLILRRRRTAIR